MTPSNITRGIIIFLAAVLLAVAACWLDNLWASGVNFIFSLLPSGGALTTKVSGFRPSVAGVGTITALVAWGFATFAVGRRIWAFGRR